MKKITATLFVLLAAFVFIAVNPAEANAQRRSRSNQVSRAQLDRLIRNVEERVDRFTSQLDDSLDRSRLNNTNREDRINERAEDLENATDELRREFDRNDSKRENSAEVRRCLNIASDLNAVMRNRKFNRATENNWRAVVNELNILARAYNLPKIGAAYR